MRRALEERRQRGHAIAATANITPKFGYWIVPSQSGNEPYVVRVNQEKPSCTCQDHETTGLKCKHIFAAEFVAAGTRNPTPIDPVVRRAPNLGIEPINRSICILPNGCSMTTVKSKLIYRRKGGNADDYEN